MIDFHSHVLPKMDDGSRSSEDSVKMLVESKRQGVDIMAATPHFYARDESPDSFLERRKKSFERLRDKLNDDMPKLILGSEVLYFPGIARAEDVSKLTLENTDILLLEMPFTKWHKNIVSELRSMESNLGVRLVLAHIERYRSIQDKKLFKELINEDFMFQLNAEAFLSWKTRSFAINMIKTGRMHFIGSDCHNLTSRSPNIGKALKVIESKTIPNTVARLDDISHKILFENEASEN